MDMNERSEKVRDRVRLQTAQMRLNKMQRKRRELDAEMEHLRGELDAEREAREELSSLVKDIGSKKGGLVRLTLFAGIGYLLGARAGRTRYEQIVLEFKKGWRSLRDLTRGGMQVGAMRSGSMTSSATGRADLPVG